MPIVLKSGSLNFLEHSGLPQACNWIAFRRTDEQKHLDEEQIASRVVKRRLGCNGASLCDRCLPFRGCSDDLETSDANHPAEQREITEKEYLNNSAAKASKLTSSLILRNPKNGQPLSYSLQ